MRTLPNFNPYTVSSGPGQDIAGDAWDLISGRTFAGDDEARSDETRSDGDSDDDDEDVLTQVCPNGWTLC